MKSNRRYLELIYREIQGMCWDVISQHMIRYKVGEEFKMAASSGAAFCLTILSVV